MWGRHHLSFGVVAPKRFGVGQVSSPRVFSQPSCHAIIAFLLGERLVQQARGYATSRPGARSFAAPRSCSAVLLREDARLARTSRRLQPGAARHAAAAGGWRWRPPRKLAASRLGGLQRLPGRLALQCGVRPVSVGGMLRCLPASACHLREARDRARAAAATSCGTAAVARRLTLASLPPVPT